MSSPYACLPWGSVAGIAASGPMPQEVGRTSEALESFRRIRGEMLVDLFYKYLLASDERIKSFFVKTNFAEQKQMVRHGILMLLNCANGDAISQLALRRLGHTHHTRIGILPDMYKHFVDCLIKAAAELDPMWSPRIERAWRADLLAGIEVMKKYATG